MFEDFISPFLYSCFSLWLLYADFMALLKNDITGTIPTEFGQLTNMTRLDMQEMDLTGTLPSELGSMSLLSKLLMHLFVLLRQWQWQWGLVK